MENSRDQLSTFSRSKLFMKDKGKGNDEQNGNRRALEGGAGERGEEGNTIT